MRIRAAGPDDVAAVLTLWDRSRSRAASTPDSEEALARLLGADPGALLVAEVDGELVGTLIAVSDGWRGNMYRLAVAPEHRRRGIAARLVESGHERLRAAGTPRITALVGREDDEARSLWAAVGYADDPDVARFVRDL